MRDELIKLICEAEKADTKDAPFSEFLADFLIATGAPLQRWISVSERLPAADFSEGEEFNICIANYNWENGTWTREVKTALWSGDYFYRAGSGKIHSKITHWKSLPELPKED